MSYNRIPVSSLLNPVGSHEHARNDKVAILRLKPRDWRAVTKERYAERYLLNTSLESPTAASSTKGSTESVRSQKAKELYDCPLNTCRRTFSTPKGRSSHYRKAHMPSRADEFMAQMTERQKSDYYHRNKSLNSKQIS